MKPRILFGGLFHETHTFLPEPTRWADFRVTTGAEILAKEGDESPTDGFLGEARTYDWEVVPTVDARAMPSGPVEDAVFERFWTEFEQRARPALAAGIDAIFLVLHGAMVSTSFASVFPLAIHGPWLGSCTVIACTSYSRMHGDCFAQSALMPAGGR